MKTSDFDYELPQELIAQTPIEPRDHSRLLVYDRADRSVRHLHFYDLPQFLHAGDALVINETKVIPARCWARRRTPACRWSCCFSSAWSATCGRRWSGRAAGFAPARCACLAKGC